MAAPRLPILHWCLLLLLHVHVHPAHAFLDHHPRNPIRRTASNPKTEAFFFTHFVQSSCSQASRTALFDTNQARRQVAQGMSAFRQGNVPLSIELFDQAEQEEPRYTPFLWQRGLSYYYANEFDKARNQFRTDVQVNPLDVEEIVWDIASALRLEPRLFPVPNALSLPLNQKDRRPIMNVVYRLFRGQATEAELAQTGQDTKKASDEFYSLFYLALFAEARQETTKAEHYMRQSTQTEYAKNVGQADYMTAVASVHCQLRGWI